MQDMKSNANAVRSKLDEKDIGIWHKLTSFTNLTGDVMYSLKRQFSPELCTVAWAKMYEMLYRFRLLEQRGPVRSAHVCEAPGGFIAATNHYLRQMHGDQLDWTWKAMTLSPYFEDNDSEAMVEDDQFIIDTISNWDFGDDDSGNIMSSANIRALWARLGGKVDLVTGDGSINCQSNPNEQELTVAHLHFCEAVFALGALRPGGDVVLKMFTLFENQSVELVYLMATHFGKLSIFKPATSKGGNAEVYLVARDFRGIDDVLLERLVSHVDPQPPALGVSPDPLALLDITALPQAFLQEMKACARQFSKYFCDVICRNLDLDEHGKSKLEDRVIRDEKRKVAEEFISRYRIRAIPASQRIVKAKLITTQALSTGHIVSSSHGQQSWTKKGRAGATLADRQRHHDEHREDWTQNHSTATSVLATRASSPPVGNDENPSKRQRLEHTKAASISPGHDADQHGGDTTRDLRSPGTASATVPEPPQAPVSFAERMMAKMGHVSGMGLGAHHTGIRVPIEPEGNMQQTGLGFADHKFASGLEDGPYFLNDFDDVMILPESECACDPVAEKWPVIVAPALLSVSTSKFCRHEIKQRLTTQRRTELPTLLERISTSALPQNLLAVSFPCVALSSVLSERFPSTRSHEAAILALLDDRCTLSLVNFGAELSALDFHGSQSGFAAYLRWHCPVATVCVVERSDPESFDSSPAPVGGAIHNPLLTCADVDACTAMCIARGHPITLAILDGGVDTATEVAGLGNAHVERWRKRTLLAQLRAALSVMARGGILIAHISDTFTRFTVSLLYTIGLAFADVRIVKPFPSAPWTCDRFVVARGYRAANDAITPFLATVHAQLDSALDDHLEGQLDVLTFVPMPRLLSSVFFRYVTRVTERFAQREANAMAAAAEIAAQQLPSDDDLAKTRAEALANIPFFSE